MNNPTTCMCGKEMETCVYPKCREFTQPYKPQPQDIAQVLSDAGDALVERGEGK